MQDPDSDDGTASFCNHPELFRLEGAGGDPVRYRHGDLFVIRIAGNVADVDEVGTIEYGVDHLGTPVLVVLGHTRCGAVTAVAQGAKLHGNIPRLVDNIKPAVDKVKAKNPKLSGDALVEEAVRANVWQAVEDVLKRSQAVRARVKDGSVIVLGAVFEIDSGKME